MMNLPTDLLMQLVQARHACLVQLRDFGRRQMDLINQGNVTGLLDLLTMKQKPLNDIQRIEKALDPYRTQDPAKRPWPSAGERAACAQLVAECDAMLKEIVAQEKLCEETMVEKRDATAAELQRLRSAGQAHGAYMAPVRSDFSQVDLVSEM
jgi:hypothetical protein